MARQLLLLGERFLRHGDPVGAARTFTAASELAAVRQIHALEADAQGGLSRALEAQGDTAGALAAARASSRAGQAQLRQHHAERTQALVLSHELQTARRDVELANRRAAELERANAALVEAQAAIAQSLAEKETLLREIHHRVKNNLQVVSSLLSLQANTLGSGEARDALDTCAARVRSMALIHRRLYDVDSLTHIHLADYARDLAAALQASLAPGARVGVEAQSATVTVALAVPIGLILNELLTNAFKYGVAPEADHRRSGYAGPELDVALKLFREDDRLVLMVADNGRRAPLDHRDSSGVGTHLVEALARQLRATFTVERDAGTRATLVLVI
jgi:two-component sensor histidine kinase